MVKVASIELLNNLILDKKVFIDFIKHKHVMKLIIHLREIIKLYISDSDLIFRHDDFKFSKDGYLFSLAVSVSVLISYADPKYKYEFKKEVNLADLQYFI